MRVSEICLVTGCAGFLGSHLSERLLSLGHTVVGVDSYTDQYYRYSRVAKEENVQRLKELSGFEFVEADLTRVEPVSLMDGVTVVFHCAGQVGARVSWGRDFAAYTRNNILATQLLLEASRQVSAFVLASTLHVYGNASGPCSEDALPSPLSPYGVSRLAAENLARCYSENYRVPAVALRFGTMYGPRQRPDMLFHRLIRSSVDAQPFELFGDGSQQRDFLYVGDAVDACIRAMEVGGRGEVYNIGSGETKSLREAIDVLVPLLAGSTPRMRQLQPVPGDLACTWSSISRAGEKLGWTPKTTLQEGLRAQVDAGALPAVE